MENGQEVPFKASIPHNMEIYHTNFYLCIGSSGDDLKSTVEGNCDLCQYPLSRTPTPERFDQLNFSSLLEPTPCPGDKRDSATQVLVDRSMNLIQSVDTTRGAYVSKTTSPNLIGEDSGNKETTKRKRTRCAPPPSSCPIPKSMDVISAEEYSSLGRSAKRKFEMAYSNSAGAFYGLKSSRLETPKEFNAKIRKLYRELKMSIAEKSRDCLLSTAAAVGRARGCNETDRGEEGIDGHLQLAFEGLINLDIWDCDA